MTIFNLGSINADTFYALPYLPGPGETLAATALTTGLGGKGANQSVAAAKAGARVIHIGAVGPDGQWAIDRLVALGVDTRHIATVDTPTGHAIVMLDPAGENQIVIFPGANQCQTGTAITAALQDAQPGDWLMLQNETSHQVTAAKTARDLGLRVAYSAAPFEVGAVRAVLPYTTLLIMNAVEAEQLADALGRDLPVEYTLITRGADGADWTRVNSGETVSVPAVPVTPVDTTGAGDTFAGYTIAGLDAGLDPRAALTRAAAAAALKVTRKGTADAIPALSEVLDFLA